MLESYGGIACAGVDGVGQHLSVVGFFRQAQVEQGLFLGHQFFVVKDRRHNANVSLIDLSKTPEQLGHGEHLSRCNVERGPSRSAEATNCATDTVGGGVREMCLAAKHVNWQVENDYSGVKVWVAVDPDTP